MKVKIERPGLLEKIAGGRGGVAAGVVRANALLQGALELAVDTDGSLACQWKGQGSPAAALSEASGTFHVWQGRNRMAIDAIGLDVASKIGEALVVSRDGSGNVIQKQAGGSAAGLAGQTKPLTVNEAANPEVGEALVVVRSGKIVRVAPVLYKDSAATIIVTLETGEAPADALTCKPTFGWYSLLLPRYDLKTFHATYFPGQPDCTTLVVAAASRGAYAPGTPELKCFTCGRTTKPSAPTAAKAAPSPPPAPVAAPAPAPAPASPAGPPPPYDKLPEPLRATLQRSFDHRRDAVPGAQGALGGCFDAALGVWAGINKGMSWQDHNTLVRVYQRMEAVDRTGALWRDQVRYVLRAYTYGIYAVELVYTDREKLKPYLDAITLRNDVPKLANASGFYQCMHGGTVGWREVSSTDQLHISVSDGTRGDATEDCHIDETSFTKGRDASGKAVAADYFPEGITHYMQSQLKWIDIERPFARLDAILAKSADARPGMTPETAAALETWATTRGSEAISGERGHANAIALMRRISKDEAFFAAAGAAF